MTESYLFYIAELVDKYKIMQNPIINENPRRYLTDIEYIQAELQRANYDIINSHSFFKKNMDVVGTAPPSVELLQHELVINNMKYLCAELQFEILKRLSGFSNICACKNSLKKDTIKMYSEMMLNSYNISGGNNATEKFLGLIWDSLVSCVSRDEYFEILEKYGKETSVNTSAYIKAQKRVYSYMIIFSCLLFFLSFIGSIFGFFKIYNFINNITHIKITFASQIIPSTILLYATSVYNNKWYVFFGMMLLNLTPLHNNVVFPYLNNWIRSLMFLPYIPIKLAYSGCGYIGKAIRYVSFFVRNTANKFVNWRFNKYQPNLKEKFIIEFTSQIQI